MRFCILALFVISLYFAPRSVYALTAPFPDRSVKFETENGWDGFDEYEVRRNGSIRKITYIYFWKFDFSVPIRLEIAIILVLTPIGIVLTGLLWNSSELFRRKTQ